MLTAEQRDWNRACCQQKKMDMENINRMDINEFREKGILQEVNRQFFHPLGLALKIIIDGDNSKLGGIWDYRHDPEGILFGKGVLSVEKARKFREFQDKKHAERKEKLGFVIQDNKDDKP